MAGNFDPKTLTTKPSCQRIEKPWGYEIIWTPGEAPAVGKFLFVKTGFRFSLQWHDQKTETLCLINGKAHLVLENTQGKIIKVPMQPMKGYFIKIGQTHRVVSEKDCLIVESSTPETGNTYRLEDDFKRQTETELMRLQKNRGWLG